MSDRSWPLRPLTGNAGDGPRGPHYRIVCGKCGDDDFVSAQDMGATHPNIARKFARAGWLIGATTAADRCPACAGPSAAKTVSKGLPMVKTPPATAPLPALPGVAVVTPSPAAAMKITEVYMALSDAYDLAARGYRAGWTDERIARDLGVSVELVAKRREQDFGPVVVDTFGPDLDELGRLLLDELAAVERLQQTFGECIARMKAADAARKNLAAAYAARAK
jgi:hypothetical protein